ncbi:hypothetical protein POX_c04591 [Penicillium oxalicum]|uniref:hypothetical protein n=1 Tax=Penicillium oxalicum TaxID=69781 RepID=UPI0020B86588|nr:hypothetical protein POX_c04591 [Penicillium oxalicum]KAI2791717.1 hypothetical protein POX_c04591 [Penicillium oxalicum]
MNSSHQKRVRPPTMWCEDKPNWANLGTGSSLSQMPGEQMNGGPDSVIVPATRPTIKVFPPKIRQTTEDPWQTYEPVMQVFLGRSVCLAYRRTKKAELVNIERLKQQSSSVATMIEAMNQVSHPSFLTLLECYYHGDDAILVWEPAELSVNEILASRCPITECEIAAIVRPVLDGIKYLRDQGKALATLSTDNILLTEAGQVKIAAVERSCEIATSEMDAATLKLLALAEIVEKLMRKNPPPHPWSAEVQCLPNQLRSLSVEKMLENTYLKRLARDGGLKILVKGADKTASHKVDFFDRSVITGVVCRTLTNDDCEPDRTGAADATNANSALTELDLFFNGSSAGENFARFPSLARGIFRASASRTAPSFLRNLNFIRGCVRMLVDSLYDTRDLEDTLKHAIDPQRRMFDVPGGASPAGCRVAIITSRASDGKACFLANYRGLGQRDTDAAYAFLAPQSEAENPFLWEAGLCSVAPPGFFRAKSLVGFGPMQDRGVRANNPLAIALKESTVIWPSAKKHDLLLSVGTGYSLPASEPTRGPFNALREGALPRMIRAMISSLCIDGRQGYHEALNYIPELASSDIFRAILATAFFFFELDDIPVKGHGAYFCRGSILCSRENTPTIVKGVLAEFPGARFRTAQDYHLGPVGEHDGCSDCGYYRKKVAFSVGSLQEEFTIQICGNTSSQMIGGFPKSVQQLTHEQQAYAHFGRADHDVGMDVTSDDASSIYSRPPEAPQDTLSWKLMPIILPIRHDLPEINSLDHQIAMARGSTIALETTRTRIQSSKSQNRLSLSELRKEKLRQRDQQENENQFYRDCFENLHQLLLDVVEAAQDLTLQYYFEPETSPVGNEHVQQAIHRLRAALGQSKVHEAQAEQEWKRQWSVSRVWSPPTRWI